MVGNKGGYVIINKALNNVYELAKNALTSGKPILWYENDTTCYYIDTITLSGTDIVLTKGGKTITIEADGDITETGNIQVEEKHLYKHHITVGIDIVYEIYNNNATEYDFDTFLQYCKDLSTSSTGKGLYSLENEFSPEDSRIIKMFGYNNDTSYFIKSITAKNNNSFTYFSTTISKPITFVDTVTQII